MNSFYSVQELKELGIRELGDEVLISKKASIYGAEHIRIGHHVRIDDFCILSGNISLGNYIHIAMYSALMGGQAGITMEDFSGLSSRVVIYAQSDDYSGNAMSNPTVPLKYRAVSGAPVILKKHVLIGTGCTILPGVAVGEGASVGAMSLIIHDIEPWTINIGIPCRKIKNREKNILKLEQDFLNSMDM